MSIFCCSGSIQDMNDESSKHKLLEKESKKRSKQIDKELKKSGKSYRETIKLLLLGTGESGKSTVLKQMRIIHTMKFSLQERQEKIYYIKSNLRDSILSILDAMERYNINFENEQLKELKDFVYENIHLILIGDKIDASTFIKDDNQEEAADSEKLWNILAIMWNDNGFKKCAKLGYKYHLINSYEYFLDHMSILRRKDYLPSDQDILRCRVLTTGIVETRFLVNNVKFHVFDVGGQRDQRRKWIECFNEVTAIIFVADLSSFDMTLREDSNVNRLRESLETFRQIWKNRYLRNISVILFLNKYDILVKKIVEENCKLEEYFPNYEYFRLPPIHRQPDFCVTNEDPSVTKAKMFILEQFLQITTDPNSQFSEQSLMSSKFCIPYFTTAIETENIKKIFKACSHILKKEHLEKCGLI
jgi:guanine nucleotide-binding protein G(olf) subunit alpha